MYFLVKHTFLYINHFAAFEFVHKNKHVSPVTCWTLCLFAKFELPYDWQMLGYFRKQKGGSFTYHYVDGLSALVK